MLDVYNRVYEILNETRFPETGNFFGGGTFYLAETHFRTRCVYSRVFTVEVKYATNAFMLCADSNLSGINLNTRKFACVRLISNFFVDEVVIFALQFN